MILPLQKDFINQLAYEAIQAIHAAASNHPNFNRKHQLIKGTIQNLAVFFSEDRKPILATIAPVKAAAKSQQGDKDGSYAFSKPDAEAPCIGCEETKAAMRKIQSVKQSPPSNAAPAEMPNEAALPPELFDAPPPLAKRDVTKEADPLAAAETVEEILAACGHGVAKPENVKERLFGWLDVTHAEYKRSWGVERLAEALLKTKGITE